MIPLDASMCDRCNPLGLPQPSPTQAHGTIFLAIGLSVLALVLLGHLAVTGLGPFSGSVAAVEGVPSGLQVSLSVRNDGTAAGSATCRVFDPTEGGIAADSAYVLTPRIGPGQAVTFSEVVTSLGTARRTLGVDCR